MTNGMIKALSSPSHAPQPANDHPFAEEPKKKAKADKAPRRRRMAFLPKKVQTKTARNGRQYIKARGLITYRRKSFEYTLMVPFWRYHRFAEALEANHPIELEGYRRQVETDKNGKPINGGGTYFEADTLLGVLDAGHEKRGGSTAPTRSLAGHERRGYYRRQHFGPGNAQVKLIWIDKVEVNGGRKAA
ncbi:hypothetical protein [Croceicoccus gelatinilyticus]|uniref:hypothetical protein n=1 Tax=Croceicoccus gelatinilyticus TaxID=2835536 RepID=UPI001BD16968|nr:hypothetical protein [Croceicoccus gelatinilyticus]MBS7671620.1 hypothetical protein [Croceicoccus gelatinilyticus]